MDARMQESVALEGTAGKVDGEGGWGENSGEGIFAGDQGDKSD